MKEETLFLIASKYGKKNYVYESGDGNE